MKKSGRMVINCRCVAANHLRLTNNDSVRTDQFGIEFVREKPTKALEFAVKKLPKIQTRMPLSIEIFIARSLSPRRKEERGTRKNVMLTNSVAAFI